MTPETRDDNIEWITSYRLQPDEYSRIQQAIEDILQFTITEDLTPADENKIRTYLERYPNSRLWLPKPIFQKLVYQIYISRLYQNYWGDTQESSLWKLLYEFEVASAHYSFLIKMMKDDKRIQDTIVQNRTQYLQELLKLYNSDDITWIEWREKDLLFLTIKNCLERFTYPFIADSTISQISPLASSLFALHYSSFPENKLKDSIEVAIERAWFEKYLKIDDIIRQANHIIEQEKNWQQTR